MTDQEINLAIAKAKGLELDKGLLAEGKIVASCFSGKRWGKVDYINDPALSRKLELELLEVSWNPVRMKQGYGWKDWEGAEEPRIIHKHFGKATALAWLKMKGVKE